MRMTKLSTRPRKIRRRNATANESLRKHTAHAGIFFAPLVPSMAPRIFSFCLAVALGACSDKTAEVPGPAPAPAPSPTLVALRAEIKTAESTNTEKLAATAEALQKLSQEKAQAVHDQRTGDIVGIDREGAAKHQELQTLEQTRRELEAQKAELAEEETEAAKIDDGVEAPPALTPIHTTLPETAQAFRLSSPLLLPKLEQVIALPYAQILKRDAETMLIVTIANRGLQIVQIKTAGADQKPSQTLTRIPLNLEEDSVEAMNLRKVRLTRTGGLDVLLLNDTRLELIRLDAKFTVKSRAAYRQSAYDAKLGYTAVFTPGGSVVWTHANLLMKSDLKMGRPLFCHLPYRGHFGVNVDHAVQIYETAARGEYLAVGYSDLGLMPAIERVLRISFNAPKTAQNPCGIRSLAESKNRFEIAGTVNRNLGNYFFSHGPQRLGLAVGAIHRPTSEAGAPSYSKKLYTNAFVAAGRVAGVSGLRDETQIDILGADLTPQTVYRHTAKIYDATSLNDQSRDVLVADSQGAVTLVDVGALPTGAAETPRETRRLSEEPHPIRFLDVRLGEKSDIVPFVIGHDYGDRNFDQFGFIRVMPAK